jgi:hypothetical protein
MSHGFGNGRSQGPSGFSGISGYSGISGFSGANLSPSTAVRRKDANQTITSGAGWIDDDTLTFSIGANEVWVGQIVTFTVSRSGDLQNPQVRISTGVSSSEFNIGGMSVDRDAINQSLGTGLTTTTGTESSAISCYAVANGNDGHIIISFAVKNGGSAGTFKVQWNGGSGGSTIIKGTYLFAAK